MVVGRIAREDAAVRDQADRALGEEDLVPELDRVPGFGALDEVRVRFEDREELLPGRDGLAREYPAARLRDDPIGQGAVVDDLLFRGRRSRVADEDPLASGAPPPGHGEPDADSTIVLSAADGPRFSSRLRYDGERR